MLFVYVAYRDCRVWFQFNQGECRMLSMRTVADMEGDSRIEFVYELTVDGVRYCANGFDTWNNGGFLQGSDEELGRFVVGGTYPCWYDPNNPSDAVLLRRISWFHAVALVPLLFCAIGVVGHVCLRRSEERRQ
jgi:hypothetical protein